MRGPGHRLALACGHPKWAHRVRLDIAPPSFADRVREIDTLPPRVAAEKLTLLVRETHDLLERHLPEADPRRLSQIFDFARAPFPS